MRSLRHKLAHGNNNFKIKETELNSYKKEFGESLIISFQKEENIHKCKISNDFTSIIKFNDDIIDFMKRYLSIFYKESEIHF